MGSTRLIKLIIFASLLFFLLLFCIGEKLRLNSHYSLLFYKWARGCEQKCGVQKRWDYYRKALYHNPAFGDIYYRLGLLSESKGDYLEALAFYKKAAALNFAHHEAQLKVGLHHFKEHRFEKALRHLLLADKYEPDYTDGEDNLYLAQIYEKRGEYKSALDHYIKSVASGGRSARAFIGPGVMYHLLGDEEHAKEQVVMLPLIHGRLDLAQQLEEFIKTGRYPEAMEDE